MTTGIIPLGRVTLICTGAAGVEHERFVICEFRRFTPAEVPPFHCPYCTEPLPEPPGVAPVKGCLNCGLNALAAHGGGRKETPSWNVFEQWVDDSGRKRRTRRVLRRRDGESPEGHPDYMRKGTNGGVRMPRNQWRFSCGSCPFDERSKSMGALNDRQKLWTKLDQLDAAFGETVVEARTLFRDTR